MGKTIQKKNLFLLFSKERYYPNFSTLEIFVETNCKQKKKMFTLEMGKTIFLEKMYFYSSAKILTINF